MPSPFPGMDPYLEAPSLWPDVHLRLINGIAELVLQQVRPKYFCQAEERVYLIDEDDPALNLNISDIAITEAIPVVNLIDDVIREPYLQIIDANSEAVVTEIEVLSPTNKVPRSNGMASDRKKRDEVLQSTANWVEIDLLRGGRHTRLKGRFRESDYRMHWSRVKERPKEWVLPVSMSQQLPKIPIPLWPKHLEAELDLQAVLNLVYDRAGYDLVLDYRSDPSDPPLTDVYGQLVHETLTTLRNAA